MFKIMKIINNSHKIYFLGGVKFLVVQKATGVYPTQWNKTFINADELYKIIVEYYSVENAFCNFFKNNKDLHLIFSCTISFEEFLNKLPLLKLDNKIIKVLNSCEVHDFNIEAYEELNKGLKHDVIFDYANYKNYIFVAA